MLTEAQQRVRENRVGASFAPILMAGDEAKILREWQRLSGHPDYEPEDLSDSWPVSFGSFIEPYALDWHERKTGRPLTRRGESVVHPERDYVSCTLDAYRADDRCVIDCKAPGRWRKLEDVLSYYVPQMVVQRACVGADCAALLVVHGGGEPEEHPIHWDAAFEAQVWERIDWFWRCVENLVSPVAVAPVVTVVADKVADMGASNAWCANAGIWLENKAAAKAFRDAEKELKAAIPADAKRAFGGGVDVTRAKNGSLTIRETRQ